VNFKFPQYEFKSNGVPEWKEISEVAALESLADNFTQIFPILTELLKGSEIRLKEGICRVKRKK